MDTKELKKELVVLRNYHLESLKVLDRRIAELDILSPSNPRKRRNKKDDRVKKYDNYLLTGNWKDQKEVTNKTLKS